MLDDKDNAMQLILCRIENILFCGVKVSKFCCEQRFEKKSFSQHLLS